ncbi:MFS general substrate transporter [Tothia fuscella]|uniref:MFS general substrate transporter n=1 Tax=Tothia fuscella TaxID=1048955 RepID=A0A9P4NU38_9PEZI|nr:MFS general substrate transporter [Tothia fuscella]
MVDLSEKTPSGAPPPPYNNTVLESSSDDNADFGEGVNEKSLLRKLDYKLLPGLCLLYLLSFLDRSNVANARIEGLATDLGITGNQYLTGLTLYFIGYVIFEVPCNIILKRWTPNLWLPTLTLGWGIVSTLMGVTQNLSGFFAVRFFLGVAESGLFPGVCYFLSMWYKRRERQYRIALFFSAASLAGAFGGILAFGIAKMKGVGGYNGWRWIFIIEGLLTIVIAIAGYWFIHNYPDTAKFLNPKERAFIQARLASDSDATRNEAFTWANVSNALKDPKCWLYGLAFHTMSLPLYTLSLFLPSIIRSLGYTSATAQLMTIPPYALATIFTVIWAHLSERFHRRAPFALGSTTIAIIGYIILIANESPTKRPGVSYVGTFFAACGIYPSTALSLSWPANNVSGQTKRAVATAMQISIGNLGAVLGTQLYRPNTAPRYLLGHGFALGYLFLNLVVNGTIWLVLSRENKRRDDLGETARFEDVGADEDWKGDDDVRWRFST